MGHGSEIEIKLAVTSIAAAKRGIRKLGFVEITPRHFESNVLYDFEDLRLRNSRCLLRLRRADREWWLTFKGPPAASVHYKSRPEMETRIEDGVQLEAILKGLGLEKAFRYDKYRTIYAPRVAERGALLVLDETPIGKYLELEGPEAWIDRTAKRLGYRREDYITASYGALFRSYCERQGITCQDMVFKRRAD